MIVANLKKVKTKYYKKEFNITDILGISRNAQVFGDGSFNTFYMHYGLISLPNSNLKILDYNDGIFYGYEQGKLYVIKKNVEKVINTNVSNASAIYQITKGDSSKLFLINKNGFAEIIYVDEFRCLPYGLPDGEFSCLYNEMLFVGGGNTVYFSKKGDITDFTMSLDAGGYITTKAEDGNISDMLVFNDKLVIFTDKAVYEFTALGERIDYTLKRVCDKPKGVMYNSARVVGNCIMFIIINEIYSYKDGQIKKRPSFKGEYSFDASAVGVYNNSYVIRGCDLYGDFVTMMHDEQSDLECVLDQQYKQYLKDGYNLTFGMGIDLFDSGYMYGTYVKYICNSLDFGEINKKILHEVVVKTTGACTMTIKYDGGSTTYKLERGINKVKMSLPSYSFRFEFEANSQFMVEKIQAKYRFRGE